MAKILTKKADKDDHLWLRRVCSFEGEDYSRTADKLTKILQVDLENIDRQSEGWFLLGESYRNLKDKDADKGMAREAYKNSWPTTPVSPAAPAINWPCSTLKRGKSTRPRTISIRTSKSTIATRTKKPKRNRAWLSAPSSTRAAQADAKNSRDVVHKLEGNLDRSRSRRKWCRHPLSWPTLSPAWPTNAWSIAS